MFYEVTLPWEPLAHFKCRSRSPQLRNETIIKVVLVYNMKDRVTSTFTPKHTSWKISLVVKSRNSDQTGSVHFSLMFAFYSDMLICV